MKLYLGILAFVTIILATVGLICLIDNWLQNTLYTTIIGIFITVSVSCGLAELVTKYEDSL